MGNLRKVHIALSIVITAIFLCIGAFWCTRSYVRLWETITGMGSSIKFYFCEILRIITTNKIATGISNTKILETFPIPSPTPLKYAPRFLPFTSSVKYALNFSQNALGVDGKGMTSPATTSDGSITSTFVVFSISNISQK